MVWCDLRGSGGGAVEVLGKTDKMAGKKCFNRIYEKEIDVNIYIFDSYSHF